MLCWNVSNLLTDRGIPHPYQWMRKHGISPNRARKLLNGEASDLKLKHVAILCRFLRCTPNDLLVWKEEADSLQPHHPLLQLVKPSGRLAITEDLRNMNPDELKLMQQYMDELKTQRKG